MTRRVFVEPGRPIVGSELTLDVEESHYLVRVRRTREGTPCELLDRAGSSWNAELIHADPRAAVVSVLQQRSEQPTAPTELWLAIPDGPALLESLSRATEMGATQIRLLNTQFGFQRLPSQARIARCLDAAMRQSGRRMAPHILAPLTLDEALEQADAIDISLLACTADLEDQNAAVIGTQAAVRLAIGPEGGFSTTEHERFLHASFRPLRLGSWILRSEVAVAAALAILHDRRLRDDS